MRRCIALALALLVVLPTAGPPAAPAFATTFTVNSVIDETDAAPGNGSCVSAPSGLCTLRAAVMEANALGGADAITLPSGTYTLTLTGTAEDAAATGDLGHYGQPDNHR